MAQTWASDLRTLDLRLRGCEVVQWSLGLTLACDDKQDELEKDCDYKQDWRWFSMASKVKGGFG